MGREQFFPSAENLAKKKIKKQDDKPLNMKKLIYSAEMKMRQDKKRTDVDPEEYNQE